MSYPDENMPPPAAQHPIPVLVRNWQTPPTPKRPTKTVLQTYSLDPAAAIANVQVAAYEPTRTRISIKSWTAAIAILTEKPIISPELVSVTHAPQGAYLNPADGAQPWDFWGCDPIWINSLGTITLVTVIKEYE
jgi:hypothetical protein